jgi:hypothetical protein
MWMIWGKKIIIKHFSNIIHEQRVQCMWMIWEEKDYYQTFFKQYPRTKGTVYVDDMGKKDHLLRFFF